MVLARHKQHATPVGYCLLRAEPLYVVTRSFCAHVLFVSVQFPFSWVYVFCTRLLTTAVHHHHHHNYYYCTITTTVCTLLRWNALQMCISQHTL